MISILKSCHLWLLMLFCQNVAYTLGANKSELFFECVISTGIFASCFVGTLGIYQRNILLHLRNRIEGNRSFNELDYQVGAAASFITPGLCGALIGYVSFLAGRQMSQGMAEQSTFFLQLSLIFIGGFSVLYTMDDSLMRKEIALHRIKLQKKENKEP